jgi:outer membrane protein OmpA-like peptidoglycan-associated protein
MKKNHYIHAKWLKSGIWLRLYNFPVNRWNLQPDHKLWLDDLAVSFLNENSAHTFVVVGIASRTGPEAYNLVLSQKRAQEVFQYLKNRHVGGQSDARLDSSVIGGGEGPAQAAGQRGNTEDGYFRAVEIWLLKNIIDYQQFKFARPLPQTHGMV